MEEVDRLLASAQRHREEAARLEAQESPFILIPISRKWALFGGRRDGRLR